jgi:hypothetical protein
MVNTDYRVDLIVVESTQKELTAMQTKINQWITTGKLVKYQTKVLNDKAVLFEICRKKGE